MASVDEDTRTRLVKAWIAWDGKPGADNTAAAMEDACKVVVEPFNASLTQFRITLAHLRELGYRAAVDAAVLELEIDGEVVVDGAPEPS